MLQRYLGLDDDLVLPLLSGRHGEALAIGTGRAGPEAMALAMIAAVDQGDIDTAIGLLAREDESTRATPLWNIAVANLDQVRGRLSDAFTSYEVGLEQAKDEAVPGLFTYGRIWRDLALARFGDHSSIPNLEMLAATAFAQGDEYAFELATAFRAAAGAILGRGIPLPAPVLSTWRNPGLAALWEAAAILTNTVEAASTFIPRVLASDGVPGMSELVVRVAEAMKTKDLDAWIGRHVDPIGRAVAADDARIFPNMPDEPRMAPMDCARCDGRCCYDGVYVTGPEEERIRAFMKLHPERFGRVPEDFLEEGEWGFLFHGKRTIRVPHTFDRPDFPRHFTHTKCVFALPSGECSLQKAATENLCHPWKVKPELCWEFPLIGLFNDNAMEKPHYFGEPDPGFYDADHPGYLSFMPCARTKTDGASWKRMYRTEFLHYFKAKGIKR